jgi:hypothetical protein
LSDSGIVPVNDNSLKNSDLKFDRFEISELIVEVKSFLDKSKNTVERKYGKSNLYRMVRERERERERCTNTSTVIII